MQLSPLQSRLAASVIASCILIALYLFLLSPQFALAAELNDFTPRRDTDSYLRQWMLAQLTGDGAEGAQGAHEGMDMYEPDFGPFDRSIMGRASSATTSVSNNGPKNMNLNPGASASFIFEASSLPGRQAEAELKRGVDGSQDAMEAAKEARADSDDASQAGLARRQQISRTLWITANTCIQPEGGNITTGPAPQLSLSVSTSQGNETVEFVEGAVAYNTTLSGDVSFTVTAPNVSSDFSSTLYNFDVAASVDQAYHAYSDSSANLFWVDSDAKSTLLTTGTLSNNPNSVLKTGPYTMFAWNQNQTNVHGVRRSYCGLKQYAQIGGDRNSNMMSMVTNEGRGNTTRQDFYFGGLNSSTKYMGILAEPPGGSGSLSKRADAAGGGGVVYKETAFDTKDSGTCTIIFNLTFCDQTAYAVPGNSSNFADASVLGTFYDTYAKSVYANFEKALQQVACDTDATSQYSLARNCNDCRAAYKNWLCSVAIPRCEDFSSTDDWLQPRNILSAFANGTHVNQSYIDRWGANKAFTTSRNSQIDAYVQPGPYKEVLPCESLCYDIVKSCPSSLGLSCPQAGQRGFNTSYGTRASPDDTNVTCNYPGSAHEASWAPRLSIPWMTMAALVGCTLL